MPVSAHYRFAPPLPAVLRRSPIRGPAATLPPCVFFVPRPEAVMTRTLTALAFALSGDSLRNRNDADATMS